MSQLKQVLLDDIRYTAWANQVLLNSCSTLSPVQLDRDCGASHSSILKTFRHIYYTERVWLQRLVADALPPLVETGDQRLFGDPPPEPSLEELMQRWPAVWLGLCEWIEAATDDAFIAQMATRTPDGGEFRLTRWEIITHAVNHSTIHRGQIITMLRALGAQPPNTDMFSFYLAR